MHYSMYNGTDYLVFASKLIILSGPVHTYQFSLENEKFFFVFAVFKIYPFTRSVFDTVTSSSSKSSVSKSPHENTKTVLST